MQFFKIDAVLVSPGPIKSEDEKKAFADGMPSITQIFFHNNSKKLYIFIATASGTRVSFGAIVKSKCDATNGLHAFLEYTKIKCDDICIEEITYKTIISMMQRSASKNFIDSDHEAVISFGIDDLTDHFYHSYLISESLMKEMPNKTQILKAASEILCEDTLSVEIKRIFEGQQKEKCFGHPVHYMVLSNDSAVKDKIVPLLVSSLYLNDRIKSKRYFMLNFIDSSDSLNSNYEKIYRASFGGAVVVSYELTSDIESDNYSKANTKAILQICTVMKKYKNDVLTILCLPRNNANLKLTFENELTETSFVTISQEVVFGSRAKKYLNSLAKEYHVATDKTLFQDLKNSSRKVTAAELDAQFDRWFSQKLKTDIYPQYAYIPYMNQLAAAAKPKGSAYDELFAMIGLNQAKMMIKQMLDYYKAQKLFQSLGMQQKQQTRHMVFTGNAGTAKTTVARLFAQIMRDNGLLDQGSFVECGRGDLVGKYVGWTAPIVQKKFQEAKGGVLFIDEAYSLVDDKNGLYGDEAINTIVQEMENHRNEVVVIFAGYPDKMQEFVQRNPGLKSRIAFYVSFQDYNAKELLDITVLLAKKQGNDLSEEAKQKLLELYAENVKVPDFGNGRFVRNLLERAGMKQASRLLSVGVGNVNANDIKLLLADDFEIPETIIATEAKKIGFR